MGVAVVSTHGQLRVSGCGICHGHHGHAHIELQYRIDEQAQKEQQNLQVTQPQAWH